MKPEFNIDALKNKIQYLEQISDFLDEKIPNLKKTWPILGDYTINNRWDPNIDANLEAIGTGHYTLVKSINYIYQNKEQVFLNDPELRYKNIFFHYGLIIDCINQIAFHILKFQLKLYNQRPFLRKLSIKSVILKTIKWYCSEYIQGYRRISEQGGFILYKIQPSREYINKLKKNKKYNSFAPTIRPIRNTLIHNPSIDIFNYKPEQDIRVVKLKKITKYKFLNNIEELKSTDLEHPLVQMKKVFEDAVEMINSVWNDLFYILEKMHNDKKFEKLKFK